MDYQNTAEKKIAAPFTVKAFGWKAILMIALCLSPHMASAGIFGVLKVPLKHPIANAILATGGYATVKAYCNAGAPALQINDDTGRPRMARIDCATIGSGLESKLGDLSESADRSSGLFGQIKAAVSATGTRELRKNLNVVQVATGMPPDPDDCDAHHIVPQNEARPWAARNARLARAMIDGCVDIDSAENGIYLPGKKDGSSQCKGSYHKTLHTKDYYKSLAVRLGRARESGGCNGVMNELRVVKSLLQSGEL